MSGITTHILDTSRGKPAAGVPIRLYRLDGADWHLVGKGSTDADGRLKTLVPDGEMRRGTWRIHFDTGAYFEAGGVDGFYPYAEIVFTVVDAAQHFHVPLLLNPFGYSTYRGS